MSFYDDMADVADGLLREFGVAVSVKYASPGVYDPATGSVASAFVSVSSIAYIDDYADRDIDGTNILQGDRRVYLSAVGMTKPQPGDKILIDGVEFAIKQSKAIPAAGGASLFDLQVRK